MAHHITDAEIELPQENVDDFCEMAEEAVKLAQEAGDNDNSNESRKALALASLANSVAAAMFLAACIVKQAKEKKLL